MHRNQNIFLSHPTMCHESRVNNKNREKQTLLSQYSGRGKTCITFLPHLALEIYRYCSFLNIATPGRIHYLGTWSKCLNNLWKITVTILLHEKYKYVYNLIYIDLRYICVYIYSYRYVWMRAFLHIYTYENINNIHKCYEIGFCVNICDRTMRLTKY